MKNRKVQPRDIMMDLAERAMMHKIVDSTNRSAKPGELIRSLGPVKRELLKNLKSDDIKDIRWPLC